MVRPSEHLSAPLVLGVASLLLFLLSAISGLLVAYDWAIACAKFFTLMFGVVAALCIAGVGRFYPRAVMPVALGFAAVMLAGDFVQIRAQVPAPSSLVEQFAEPVIVLLPLCTGWMISWLRRDAVVIRLTVGGLCAIVLFWIALLLIESGDVSSGLALGLGIVVTAWLLAQRQTPWKRGRMFAVLNRLLIAAGIFAVAVYGWAILSPTAGDALGAWLPRFVPERLHRYQGFLAIVSDYPFSGSGLAVSEMVYSSYLFMVQVPFTAQAHNLFLQVAVEQGLPGLIGYVGLLLASLWALRQYMSYSPSYSIATAGNRANDYLLAAATVGSLVTLAVNGMLDADIYSGYLVSLVFVPAGVGWGLYLARDLREHQPYEYRKPWGVPSSTNLAFLVGIAPFLLFVTAFFVLGGFSTAYANAGAVVQTRAELSIYNSQTWAMQDQVRRTIPEQLQRAESLYQAAIALNPYNVTAHWRLAQIAIAHGNYDVAEQHLAQAYALAPHHRAVRQLLGEIYAIQGKTEQAIQLWEPLDVGQNQLRLRQGWYEMIGDLRHAFNLYETVQIYEQSACCP